MTNIAARLTEAADYLDYLYEGAKHIPTDLEHVSDIKGYVARKGWPHVDDDRPIAHFFWGGAAEVFLALGPAVLPILTKVLRDVASETAYYELINNRNPDQDATRVVLPHHVDSALALADHILKTKEN